MAANNRQDTLTLRQIRKAANKTQKQVASTADMDQADVSRLEQQAERVQIATLRRYIRALGGELVLTARFPSGQTATIRLRGRRRFEGVDAPQDSAPARRRRRRRRNSVEPAANVMNHEQ